MINAFDLEGSRHYFAGLVTFQLWRGGLSPSTTSTWCVPGMGTL
jgi:hypothetical protein